MTLLIAVFAAVIVTFKWYQQAPEDPNHLSSLCFMFWGASLMWFVDAIFEYVEQGAEYFQPAPLDMLNDAFLGLAVVAFALVVWIVSLLVKDPRGVIAKVLKKAQIENTNNSATTQQS